MRPSETLRITGSPLAYFPQLAKPLGSVNASILFSHFFYWRDKGSSELGIYRTAEEIEKETGLSVQEQRTARAKLRQCGVLIETEKRIEHRIYYKLDLTVFDELIRQHSGSNESTAPKCNINSPEVVNQHSGGDESTAVIGTVDYAVDYTVDYTVGYFVDANNFADETEISNSLFADEAEVLQTCTLVGAEAPTPAQNLADRKSKTTTADNRKRFAAIAEVFNAVFADCPAVQKVNLAKVTLENGKAVDTKTNLNRMKLVPYAWGIARQRVQAWADTDGLIDGEQPSGKHCLQWFENYFRNCKGEGFINGSQPRSAIHENWKPKFENMLKPEWIEQRVFEGD